MIERPYPPGRTKPSTEATIVWAILLQIAAARAKGAGATHARS